MIELGVQVLEDVGHAGPGRQLGESRIGTIRGDPARDLVRRRRMDRTSPLVEFASRDHEHCDPESRCDLDAARCPVDERVDAVRMQGRPADISLERGPADIRDRFEHVDRAGRPTPELDAVARIADDPDPLFEGEVRKGRIGADREQ